MHNDENVRKSGRLFVQNLALFFIQRKRNFQIEEETIGNKRVLVPKNRDLKTCPLGKRTIRRHRYKSMFDRINRVKDGISNLRVNTRYELMTENLLERVNHLMECKKRYKDPSINLEDLACELGTNRTYMSRVINQKHKIRFSSFVNNYRYNELIRLLDENPYLNRTELASRSGFNSVTTMLRVIKQNTGLSYKEWKYMICSTPPGNQMDA